MVKLGSSVKDVITGFAGIAIGRAEFMYGCSRIGVQPVKIKDGEPGEAFWFDEQRIDVIDEKGAVTNRAAPKYSMGDEAQDEITGFKGVISAIAVMFGGNIEYTLTPQKLEKGAVVPDHSFYEGRVKRLKVKNPVVTDAGKTAGPGGPAGNRSLSTRAVRR